MLVNNEATSRLAINNEGSKLVTSLAIENESFTV